MDFKVIHQKIAIVENLIIKQQYEDARQIFDELKAENYNDPRTYSLLSRIARSLMLIEESFSLAEKAVKCSDSPSVGLLKQYIQIANDYGELQKAEMAIYQWLTLDKKDFAPYLAMADVLTKQTRISEAVEILQEGILKFPENKKLAFELSQLESLQNLDSYYENLAQEIGLNKDEWFFVNTSGMGETFYFCSCMEQFRQAQREKGITDKVAVIVKKSHFELARMYQDQFSRIIVLEPQKINKYGLYQKYTKFAPGVVINTNPKFLLAFGNGELRNFSCPGLLENHLCTNWERQKVGLGLSKNTPFSKPTNLAQYEEEALSNLKKWNFPQGKTVILSPFARSLMIPGKNFWISLAKELNKNGFFVCVSQDPNPNVNYEIPDTLAIFFPYAQAILILNYAGYFIGARSGFCDILTASDCHLTILYTRDLAEKGKRFPQFNSWTLVNNGLSDGVSEFEILIGEEEEKVEAIVSNISNICL